MNMKQWFLIETKADYEKATTRFEQIHTVKKGTEEHKEKMLLAFLISEYEEKQWSAPSVDPVEMIKIRMDDFGYTAADLAREYGDKGTISKVLNYKQPLSLTMIRKFSKMLRIPADVLTKEYKLSV
jgi:HTH-type transcriptional regulator / antitoxin HigA